MNPSYTGYCILTAILCYLVITIVPLDHSRDILPVQKPSYHSFHRPNFILEISLVIDDNIVSRRA